MKVPIFLALLKKSIPSLGRAWALIKILSPIPRKMDGPGPSLSQALARTHHYLYDIGFFLYSLRSMLIQSKYVVYHIHASYWKKARLFKYYNPLTDGKHQNSRCCCWWWCKNSLIFQKKGLYYLCHNSIYYNSKEWCHKKRFRDTYLLISPRQSAWQNIYHKAKNARLQNFFCSSL